MTVDAEFRLLCGLMPELRDLLDAHDGDLVYRVWDSFVSDVPVRIDGVTDCAQWSRLRPVTVGDGLVSALAVLCFADWLDGGSVSNGDVRDVELLGEAFNMFGFGVDVPVFDRVKRIADLRGHDIRKIVSIVDMLEGGSSSLVWGTKSVGGQLGTVEVGNCLSRVFVSEKMLLADPVLELEFYRRWLDRGLMQFDVVSDRNNPVVFVRDSSYSMLRYEHLASAVGLVAYRTAMRRGRPFVGIVFSTVHETYRFPGDDLLTFVQRSLQGGTNFVPVLRDALQEGGDIMFCTDGMFVDNEFREWFASEKKRLGVKCYGVSVGGNDLSDWCDSQMSLHDTGINYIEDVIR